jgi:AcrR family transcriptional regulator
MRSEWQGCILQQQRWGSNARQDDSSSGRDKILEAARYCYGKQGIAGTTLDDIAKRAKITRRTVYRYFDNKKAIIQAVVDEQALRILLQMQLELPDPNLCFADQLQVYIIYLVKNGQLAPGYQVLLGTENVGSSRQYFLSSEETYSVLNTLIEEPFLAAQLGGEIRGDLGYEELVSWLGRVIFSYIEMPVDEQILERQLARFVIPALLVRGLDGKAEK